MPKAARPANLQEYKVWAQSALGVDFNATNTKNHYETNVRTLQNTLQDSNFIKGFPAFLSKCEADYQRSAGCGLIMKPELKVVTKPFDSSITKSYRINVLRNRRFPNPPDEGWVDANNWYSRFDDLVRSSLVCKFLDGPKFLAVALDDYATSLGLSGTHVPRSTDDGYYAYHHYTAFPADIVGPNWDTHAVTSRLEVQLTTQLQEVLRELTHPLYEKARVSMDRKDDRWKWDFGTPRFRTSYLGHTLHMIEAVIVQVRDSFKSESEPEMELSAGTLPPERTEQPVSSSAGLIEEIATAVVRGAQQTSTDNATNAEGSSAETDLHG